MDLGISNRVAIVTGSSQGIGKEIAYRLAKEGVNLTICSRNKKTLMKTAKDIKKATGVIINPIQTNLENKDEIKNMVTKTIEIFGAVDILINNTGGPSPNLFLETKEKDWIDAVNQLLISTINCCYQIIPLMKKQKWGRIINMTSIAAKQPIERLILSNAIRAGILGFTKTLSNELAEDNVLINAICPGWTFTKRVKELAISKAEKYNQDYKEIIADWEKNIPLRRLAQPEEIANLVVFLSSEKASYITGTTIQVDGGYVKSII
jgi:3-oxoacyl-[acyl-carrier protein] reductase